MTATAEQTGLRPPSASSKMDDTTTATNSVVATEEKGGEVVVDANKEASVNEKHISDSEDVITKDTPANEEDSIEYPSSWKLGLITIALCLSIFCCALDNTIIAVAIPKITDEFSSLNDVGWYASAYLLTTCSLQLFFGKVYTFYSIKWVYLITLVIFEIGSLVCALAPNSDAFIVGRAVAGIGGAGLFSGALLIISFAVPLRKRPAFTGLIGGMYGIASVAGPLLGGVFTDKLTWRWCFYINLPLGAVTCVFIFFFYKSPPTAQRMNVGLKEKIKKLDLLGMFFFIPAIVCLLLALQWGGSEYEWSNGRIIALFVVAGILIVAFLGVQLWKGDDATVPPRIIKQRDIWAGSVFAACLGGSFFVLIYWIPVWFQAIKGESAVKSGIDVLPMVLATVLMSIIAGGVVTGIGYYTQFFYLSTIFMSLGAGLITTFTPETSHPAWIGYQVLFGLGVGCGMQMTLILVQTVLPMADVPVGTAVAIFCQFLGGALFSSVGQNVFTNSLIDKLTAADIPGVNPSVIVTAGATELQNQLDASNTGPVLNAYNGALVDAWYVSTALAATSVLGVVWIRWNSVKGKKIEMGGAA